MREFFRYIVLLLFFVPLCAVAQTGKWREMYKVKKKDTVYGIAKKYDITVDELREANPDMKMPGYELKHGDYIFIPFAKTASAVKAKAPKSNTIRVGIMLPLHNADGDGRRMTEYYRGFLLACDELKSEGLSTDIHAWNVPVAADISQTLADPAAKDCDIIFGPLYSSQVKVIGDFCRKNGQRLVVPFSIKGSGVQTNSAVFQVYQSDDELNARAIEAFLQRFKGYHPIFIDCNDTTSRKGIFTFAVRRRLEQEGIKGSVTNLTSSAAVFSKCFSRSQPNVVVLNTGRSPELNTALAKLNKLVAEVPGLQVSLFGYTEWLMYTKVYADLFYKYNAYIPTAAYYNELSGRTQNVEAAYKRWFGTDMLQALPRFALTGYDHAQFFLRGLFQYGKAFNGTRGESKWMPIQTPLNFKRLAGGGMQNSSFMLIHFKADRTLESISY